MSRVYNCIDSDGHILEPLELWAQYMDPQYRDDAPRLVRDDKGKERLLIGQFDDRYAARHSTAQHRVPPFLGLWRRLSALRYG